MKEITEAIQHAGQVLYQLGCLPAGTGNLSHRFEEDKVVLARADSHKGRLESDDLLVINLSGAPLPDGGGNMQKPPDEAVLHTQIYDTFPWVNSIIHTHSVNATVLSQLLYAESTLHFNGYEMQKVFRNIVSPRNTVAIPILENENSAEELVENVKAMLESSPEPVAYVIRGHGVYIWGETMTQTLNYVEALEFLFQCEYEIKDLRTK